MCMCEACVPFWAKSEDVCLLEMHVCMLWESQPISLEKFGSKLGEGALTQK